MKTYHKIQTVYFRDPETKELETEVKVLIKEEHLWNFYKYE